MNGLATNLKIHSLEAHDASLKEWILIFNLGGKFWKHLLTRGLRRPLLLQMRKSGGPKRVSDTELPKGLCFAVAPCWTA